MSVDFFEYWFFDLLLRFLVSLGIILFEIIVRNA